MAREPASYPMTSRLPAAAGGLVMFGGGALFLLAVRGTLLGDALGLVMAGLSAALAALALASLINLLRHEGWAVVLGEDALELPVAPYRSARRERIPYAAIELVGLAPPPPGEPELVVIHVSPGPQLRWIRQAELEAGNVSAIARALVERASARRGGGRVVRVANLR